MAEPLERTGNRYRQLGGGLFPKTCFRFVHRSNSPGDRSRAPMLLDLVDNLTHSSYIAHSWADAAGNRVWASPSTVLRIARRGSWRFLIELRRLRNRAEPFLVGLLKRLTTGFGRIGIDPARADEQCRGNDDSFQHECPPLSDLCPYPSTGSPYKKKTTCFAGHQRGPVTPVPHPCYSLRQRIIQNVPCFFASPSATVPVSYWSWRIRWAGRESKSTTYRVTLDYSMSACFVSSRCFWRYCMKGVPPVPTAVGLLAWD